METIEIEDREFTIANYREIEFDDPDLAEASFKALRQIDEGAFEKLKEIDRTLCDSATVAETHDGSFVIYWHERHPEICRFSDLVGNKKPGKAALTEWDDLCQRMPESRYFCELDRSEALHILMAFWLPEEVLAD